LSLHLKQLCAIKKNIETLIDSSKEVGPEGNGKKTKYMLLSRYQYAGQNNDIKMQIDFLKIRHGSNI
jgi:hypothetical protein